MDINWGYRMADDTNKTKFSISLDYRVIAAVLLIIIAGMLAVWKPWSARSNTADRTVKVTGEATIKAEPDQFLFYPSFEFKDADKNIALASLTKKSEELISKLKDLGVADNKIKSNTSGYDKHHFPENDDKTVTYSLQLTITVDTKDQAQKVQDYLVSTGPSGSVSPQTGFSETKRKELESKARDEATKNARAKAQQSANNLGFKVSNVKTIEDGAGFGEVYPLGIANSAEVRSDMKLAVQPGENELSYSVTVTYYIR